MSHLFIELLLAASNLTFVGLFIAASRRNKKLYKCPTFGCLTRQGIDVYWQSQRRHSNLALVFLDVDNMHDANNQFGYQEVDAKLKNAFSKTRKEERLGRWYSGDELILLVDIHNADLAASRLLQALKIEGLSATFGIVKAEGRFLFDSVKKASALVQASKNQNVRGVILSSIENSLYFVG